LDAEGRHAGEADQAVGRHLHELLRDPVVVGLHARALEFGVGVGEEVAHHARRAEQHLGVDAVDVLLREPRLGAEVPLVRLREGDAGPAHVRVLASGRGVDSDRGRRRVGAELPGLAALPVGHHPGRLVVELARHVLRPEMRRLQDVRVGGDQMIRAGHRVLPSRPRHTNKRSFVSRGGDWPGLDPSLDMRYIPSMTKTTKPRLTLRQVEREFGTEDACKALLTKLRWPDGKVACPRCGETKRVYRKAETDRWKCKACNKNGYRFSVLSGTVFENTNVPLTTWFRVAFLMVSSKKGISALQIHRMID